MKRVSSQLAVNVLLIVFQVSAIIYFSVCLYSYSDMLKKILHIIGLLAALKIIFSSKNPSFKIIWTVILLEFPVISLIIYAFADIERKRTGKYKSVFSTDDKSVSDALLNQDKRAYSIYKYINNVSGSAVYRNTSVQFFPCGEIFLENYLCELKKAEKSIFMEYFIIGKGYVWDKVLEILKEKSVSGKDVRIIYDGLGTVNCFNRGYFRNLSEYGIKTVCANPFQPIVNTLFSSHDHRKITVIDNRIAYTGGINLSDEYMNIRQPYGYWKDYAFKFCGDAVQQFSEMFISSWKFFSSSRCDFPLCSETDIKENDGFVVPFADVPYKRNPVGKSSYMQIIQGAERYVYIVTPYLVLDSEMISLLRQKSLSGIDVRIITPHIPDKKYVFTVTRSDYNVLIESGVRIFEYKYGFVHAKAVISDDDYAISGTVNFDFRSFHMLFENSVFIYKSKALYPLKADFIRLMHESIEIDDRFFKNLPWYQRIICSLLKFFSSLM